MYQGCMKMLEVLSLYCQCVLVDMVVLFSPKINAKKIPQQSTVATDTHQNTLYGAAFGPHCCVSPPIVQLTIVKYWGSVDGLLSSEIRTQ
jgi:hypothetical protein